MKHVVYIALSYGIVALSVGVMMAWIAFSAWSGKKRLAALSARLDDAPARRD